MNDSAAIRHPSRPTPLPFVANGPVYTPGRMAFGPRGIQKLSSNESPLGIGSMATEAIRRAACNQHLYPDADGLPLAEAIGAKFDLDPSRVFVGPGSEAILNWIIRGWAGVGDEIIHSEHGFQAYRIRASSAGAIPISASEQGMRTDIEALLRSVTERTKIIFIANPNNPTGTFIGLAEIEMLRQRLRPDVLLVIDEAYFDYVTHPGFRTSIGLVDSAIENVIVTRTFSKFFALAGLRVGWAYAPTSAMSALSRVRGPFAVSSVAMAAATAALQDQDHTQATLAHNKQWLPWLTEKIREQGYETTDSVCNFVLLKVPGGQAAATAFDDGLRNRGFIGRLATQNALPDWMRLTIGPKSCMEGLVGALRELSQSIDA